MKRQVNFRIPARILTLLLGLFISLGAYAQITVSGNVKDATGEPVIGASVRVVGTTQGTATDLDGNFTIANVQQGAKLQISYVGAKTQTVAAGQNLQITLEDDSQVLGDVVVIGYGTVKKTDLTGNVSTLKPETKNKGVVVSVQDQLSGKIAGVSVTNSGGTPGGGATIRIRGGSSLNASNDPLIVIDGVPMDNSGVKGLSNGLGMVNPNDVESYSVLKDASATAIYGSRGSNGVIIITTKKGRRGMKPQVTYNGSMTVSTKRKTIDVMNGDEYRAWARNMFAGTDREELVNSLLGEANTDWQDEITRTAVSTDQNVSLSGSVGSFLPYRVSLGYTGENGIIKTSNMTRYTAALNLNPSLLNDHLTMNLNAKYMYAKNRYADGGAIGNAVRMDPTQPVWDGNQNFGGYFEWAADNAAMNDAAWPNITNTNAPRNPVAILALTNDKARSHSFIGNAEIDYKVHGFEDLRLHLTLGGDFSGGKQLTYVDNASPQASYWGSYGWDQITKENLTLSTYAQYYKDFLERHHFDIMVGYEWQHFWHKEMSDYWGVYPANTALIDENTGKSMAGQRHNETWMNNGKGYRTENYLVSYFGRLNYSFDERYFLTFTMRADGSSRFNWLHGFDNHQWGYFPSAALKWNIKNEAFLKDNNVLSDLALRLSYGKTGQQEGIGDYGYYPIYSMNNGVQGSWYDVYGDGTLARPNAYNPDLKWETTTTYNVGLDWGFWNHRITGNIDWYYRKTTDLINYAPVAAGTNFRNMVNQNIGSLRNTGIEFALNFKAIQSKDFNWTIDYNLTYNSNKITKLYGEEGTYYLTGGISSGTGNSCQVQIKDKPSNSFFVYQQVYDKDGKPIENQVVDRNADGQITDADRYCYKSPWAPVTMGLASRWEYKNWDLGLSLRASIGNYVFNDTEDGYHNVSPGSVQESVSGNYLNNRTVHSTRYGWQTYDVPATLSDRWVQNASFLKLDHVTLGYSFNNLFKSQGNWNGFDGRVYATVNNVFCITKYKGIDPEVFGGIDNNLYPRPFSVVLGLSLSF